MKFVVVLLFALLVGTLGYEWNPKDVECVEELKLNKDEIEVQGNAWDKTIAEDNKDLNAFFECSWNKEGILKDDGEIDWDKLDKYVSDELKKEIQENKSNSEEIFSSIIAGGMIQNAVDHCHEEKLHGNSPGQIIAKVQNCIAAKLKETVAALSD